MSQLLNNNDIDMNMNDNNDNFNNRMDNIIHNNDNFDNKMDNDIDNFNHKIHNLNNIHDKLNLIDQDIFETNKMIDKYNCILNVADKFIIKNDQCLLFYNDIHYMIPINNYNIFINYFKQNFFDFYSYVKSMLTKQCCAIISKGDYLESKYFILNKYFDDKYQLSIVPINGDGFCFYRCCSMFEKKKNCFDIFMNILYQQFCVLKNKYKKDLLTYYNVIIDKIFNFKFYVHYCDYQIYVKYYNIIYYELIQKKNIKIINKDKNGNPIFDMKFYDINILSHSGNIDKRETIKLFIENNSKKSHLDILI